MLRKVIAAIAASLASLAAIAVNAPSATAGTSTAAQLMGIHNPRLSCAINPIWVTDTVLTSTRSDAASLYGFFSPTTTPAIAPQWCGWDQTTSPNYPHTGAATINGITYGPNVISLCSNANATNPQCSFVSPSTATQVITQAAATYPHPVIIPMGGTMAVPIGILTSITNAGYVVVDMGGLNHPQTMAMIHSWMTPYQTSTSTPSPTPAVNTAPVTRYPRLVSAAVADLANQSVGWGINGCGSNTFSPPGSPPGKEPPGWIDPTPPGSLPASETQNDDDINGNHFSGLAPGPSSTPSPYATHGIGSTGSQQSTVPSCGNPTWAGVPPVFSNVPRTQLRAWTWQVDWWQTTATPDGAYYTYSYSLYTTPRPYDGVFYYLPGGTPAACANQFFCNYNPTNPS